MREGCAQWIPRLTSCAPRGCDHWPLPPTPSTHSVRDFFKCLPEGVDLELAEQWSTYCEVWPHIPANLKRLSIGAFWAHPEIVARFPGGCSQIARLARYWAGFPVSNVSLERAFGIMRSMEAPQRGSLSRESVREELMLKVNRTLSTTCCARAFRAPRLSYQPFFCSFDSQVALPSCCAEDDR